MAFHNLTWQLTKIINELHDEKHWYKLSIFHESIQLELYLASKHWYPRYHLAMMRTKTMMTMTIDTSAII
jgi:hypothetical protein